MSNKKQKRNSLNGGTDCKFLDNTSIKEYSMMKNAKKSIIFPKNWR